MYVIGKSALFVISRLFSKLNFRFKMIVKGYLLQWFVGR